MLETMIIRPRPSRMYDTRDFLGRAVREHLGRRQSFHATDDTRQQSFSSPTAIKHCDIKRTENQNICCGGADSRQFSMIYWRLEPPVQSPSPGLAEKKTSKFPAFPSKEL